jgi:hypothetical protein
MCVVAVGEVLLFLFLDLLIVFKIAIGIGTAGSVARCSAHVTSYAVSPVSGMAVSSSQAQVVDVVQGGQNFLPVDQIGLEFVLVLGKEVG